MIMTRVSYAALFVLCLLGALTTFPSYAEGAGLKRTATKGQRKKAWRRRTEDWTAAEAQTRANNKGSTIVTNPSTLGKGKGGNPNDYTYTSEDENGRTTFVVKCGESAAKKAAEKASVIKNYKGGEAKKVSASTTAGTKSATEAACEDYENGSGGGDGGWASGDGGSGDGGEEYPDEGGNTGVSGATGGLASCEAIAANNGPREGDAVGYQVKLEVVKETDLDDGAIMQMMQADLQYHVAPEIADCIADDGSAGTGGGTLITDVVFEPLQEDASGCSVEYADIASTEGGECLKTVIPVTLYYTEGGDTSGFEEKVQDAIDGHQWNVPGIMQVSPVERDGTVISSIETEEAKEDDSAVGAGGYMAIAATALLLVLLAVMFVRRRRRSEFVKHVELEDDDDDTYLRDIEGESQGSNGLARVVGDDESAWDGMFSNMESRPSHQDVHACSSATCEVCERNRQAGVQFIPSSTNLAHPPMPPDAPRDYKSDDTVNL